jgi:nitroimidazol reductase NimA-like FMN-containing flavoprotein (pyridoxamine 5'-phosphate oxidase superfamily)
VEFLSAGTRTAMLGYLAADGRPLVAPVWFIVDNGELVFNTGRESAKGRALARDSRVVICVDDPHPHRAQEARRFQRGGDAPTHLCQKRRHLGDIQRAWLECR